MRFFNIATHIPSGQRFPDNELAIVVGDFGVCDEKVCVN